MRVEEKVVVVVVAVVAEAVVGFEERVGVAVAGFVFVMGGRRIAVRWWRID